MKSIFRPALLLMSGRALGFVATFIIPLVLVRVFSKDEFGTYKLLFLIFTTLYGIAQIGMAESLYYFLPGATARRKGRYLFNALAALVVSGVLCLLALWLFRSGVAGWFDNAALAEYLPLIGLFLLFMLGATVLEIGMIADKRHLYATSAYVVSDFARAAACILPALLLQSLYWLLIGMVAFAMLRFTAALQYLWYTERADLRPDAGLLKRQFSYALPFAVAVVIQIAQINYHLYVVSSSFDAATFAIYAVGCLTLPLVDFMMTSTSSVMMVKLRENIERGDTGSALEIWRDTTRKLFLLFAPLVGVLLVVAHNLIVVLYTNEYADSVPIFMLWTTAILLTALLTDSILRVYARTRLLIVLQLIQLGIIAAIIHLFISWFGLLGAVLSTLLATAVGRAVAVYKIKSILQTDIQQVMPWRSLSVTIAIAAVAAIPALLVQNSLSSLPALMLLVITGVIYAIAYTGLTLYCGPLSRAEKQDLLFWFKWPIFMARRTLGS